MRQVISRADQINEAELLTLKRRLHIASILLVFFATILVIRLWYLQILNGNEYFELSENNRTRLHWLNAPRGMISDRQGRPLIANRPYFNVTLAREDAPNPEELLHRLAAMIDAPLPATGSITTSPSSVNR